MSDHLLIFPLGIYTFPDGVLTKQEGSKSTPNSVGFPVTRPFIRFIVGLRGGTSGGAEGKAPSRRQPVWERREKEKKRDENEKYVWEIWLSLALREEETKKEKKNARESFVLWFYHHQLLAVGALQYSIRTNQFQKLIFHTLFARRWCIQTMKTLFLISVFLLRAFCVHVHLGRGSLAPLPRLPIHSFVQWIYYYYLCIHKFQDWAFRRCKLH